jgi:hypothetical protein
MKTIRTAFTIVFMLANYVLFAQQAMKVNTQTSYANWWNNPRIYEGYKTIKQCVDNKVVYIFLYDGLAIDATYSNEPCNSSTWPASGVDVTNTNHTDKWVDLTNTKQAAEYLNFSEIDKVYAPTVPTDYKFDNYCIQVVNSEIYLRLGYRGKTDLVFIIDKLTKEKDKIKIERKPLLIKIENKKILSTKLSFNLGSSRTNYIGHVTLLR